MSSEEIVLGLNRMNRDRLRGYSKNLEFYHGTQWAPSALRIDRRLTFNYCKAMVDKLSSYLMAGFNFNVFPFDYDQESQAMQAETFLRHVYKDNDMFALDYDTEVDCSILGDACYKVVWSPSEERIIVTAPDAQGIFAWWQPDNVTQVYRVASRYNLSSEEVESLYSYTPKGTRSWISELWTATEFELWVDQVQVQHGPNPYGFIPFLIFANLRDPKKFWGISDVPPIMEAQRELNRAFTQLSRILELSGNPIAVLENVDQSSDIAVQPGSVWNLPEDTRAYLLDLLQGGGVRLHIDYIDTLFRVLHDVSESPRASWGTAERDLSGVALEIELQPLLQKVRRKRLIREAVYRKRNDMILKLAAQFLNNTFTNIDHEIVWGPVLPRDIQRQVTNEVQLIQHGVHSRKMAMEELGIDDPERELARWLNERYSILKQNQELNVRGSQLKSE